MRETEEQRGARDASDGRTLEVLIVGAGFSGLGMAIRLRQGGIDEFLLLEAASEVGGTWRDAVYPGCGCDIESHLYSYSFELNPDWTRAFSRQPEIQRYILHCVDKYDLRPRIRFGARVQRAVFDESEGTWSVETDGAGTFRAHHLVTATGPFRGPAFPSVEGQSVFRGQQLHTAQWDSSVDLRGRRVALVGSGASAVQVGPAIAPEVAELAVFQRTPPWIMPRPDGAIPEADRARFRHSPKSLRRHRTRMYWRYEARAPFLILAHDFFKKPAENLARRHLEVSVPDPALRQRLTPNYRFGCKRVLVSSDWYPMLQRPNVRLVDESVERVGLEGIITRDGVQHPFDVIVWATGYEVNLAAAPYEVIGRRGLSLKERFRQGGEAYLGVNTAGFPNFHFLVGPFTGPGHQSVLAYAEAQIDYVVQIVQHRRRRGLRWLDVRRDREAAFVRQMHRRSEYTVWTSGCASWYLSEDGRNHALFPGTNIEYRLRLFRFDPADYDARDGWGNLHRAGWQERLACAAASLRLRWERWGGRTIQNGMREGT